VAIACRPATPAPSTKTRARRNRSGGGHEHGTSAGASRRQDHRLVAAMVAIDDSASMLCARVMRGSAPWRSCSRRARQSDVLAPALSGSPKPITTWPERSHRRSARPGFRIGSSRTTCRITSDAAKTSRGPRRSWRLSAGLGIGNPRGSGPRLDHELGIALGQRLHGAGRRSEHDARGKRLGSTPIVMANAEPQTTNLADRDCCYPYWFRKVKRSRRP